MGDHRAGRPARLGVFVVLVAIAVAATTWIGISVAHKQDDEKHAAVAQANGIADPILALCAQGGDVAQRLSDAGLCSAAAGVKNAPHDDPAPSGLTPDEVQSLVKSELAKRPLPQPVAPTTAQLAAAVQSFIAANPTLFKAPAPTAAQIQAAVNTYMRAHPQPVPQPVVPQYQMPGLGGFSGGYPAWPQSQWSGGGRRAPR
jgi:hypothetical protein